MTLVSWREMEKICGNNSKIYGVTAWKVLQGSKTTWGNIYGWREKQLISSQKPESNLDSFHRLLLVEVCLSGLLFFSEKDLRTVLVLNDARILYIHIYIIYNINIYICINYILIYNINININILYILIYNINKKL